jgi:hypothetical protein
MGKFWSGRTHKKSIVRSRETASVDLAVSSSRGEVLKDEDAIEAAPTIDAVPIRLNLDRDVSSLDDKRIFRDRRRIPMRA